MSEELEALTRELAAAADQLRADELEPDAAAELVERCAELAARVGAQLDRAAREAEHDAPGGGQEQLL